MNRKKFVGWGLIGYSIIIAILLLAKVIDSTIAAALWVVGSFIVVVITVVNRKRDEGKEQL